MIITSSNDDNDSHDNGKTGRGRWRHVFWLSVARGRAKRKGRPANRETRYYSQ